MGKLTISMAIFNSFSYVYQRVPIQALSKYIWKTSVVDLMDLPVVDSLPVW